jgi:hypothetical protein
MIQLVTYPLKNAILGAVKPGRLRWVDPWFPRMPLGWRDLWYEMRPRRIRWGWALLLAIAIVLIMGECDPAASTVAMAW